MNKDILNSIDKTILLNRDLLNDLDKKGGDGDYGSNLYRGIQEINKVKEQFDNKTLDKILILCGQIFMTKVGGTSGILWATFLVGMGKSMINCDVNHQSISKAFQIGVNTMASRAKTKVGEKTMLDVLIPVADLYVELAKTNKNTNEILEAMHILAIKRSDETKNMIATKGRASYLGERTLGVSDAGAKSCELMIYSIKMLNLERK